MRKLNIAIFHLAFVYSGGGEKLVLEEARGLLKKGHIVAVFSPVVDRKKCYPDLISKLPIYQILSEIPHFISDWESYQIMLTCILAPILAYKFRNYDIILAANQPSCWLAFWVKLFFGVPYVSYLAQATRFLHPRKIDQEDGLIFVAKETSSSAGKLLTLFKPLANLCDYLSIRYSSKVLANGDYIRRILDRIYRIKTNSCPAGAILKNTIIKYKSRCKGKLKIGKLSIAKPYLLLTNRHFSQKRFEYAITIMPSVLQFDPKISLLISGEETYYTHKLKEMTKELSLGDKVIFTGLVSEKNLTHLYQNALVYLYTAPEEDFGMGIIEAMANGTPIVAWASGGPGHIIKQGVTGLLASPNNVIEFGNKIIELLKNRKLARKVGLAGRQEVRAKYTYSRHCDCINKDLLKYSLI